MRLYLACWLQKYCASWFDRDQDQQSIFSKAFLEKILQIIVRYLTDEPNVSVQSVRDTVRGTERVKVIKKLSPGPHYDDSEVSIESSRFLPDEVTVINTPIFTPNEK